MHSENGTSGGGGACGVVLDAFGAVGGADGEDTAPVTVKARREVRCSVAQYRPQDCSPSESSGQLTVR